MLDLNYGIGYYWVPSWVEIFFSHCKRASAVSRKVSFLVLNSIQPTHQTVDFLLVLRRCLTKSSLKLRARWSIKQRCCVYNVTEITLLEHRIEHTLSHVVRSLEKSNHLLVLLRTRRHQLAPAIQASSPIIGPFGCEIVYFSWQVKYWITEQHA